MRPFLLTSLIFALVFLCGFNLTYEYNDSKICFFYSCLYTSDGMLFLGYLAITSNPSPTWPQQADSNSLLEHRAERLSTILPLLRPAKGNESQIRRKGKRSSESGSREIKIQVNILLSERTHGEEGNEEEFQILVLQVGYQVLPTEMKSKLEQFTVPNVDKFCKNLIIFADSLNIITVFPIWSSRNTLSS